MSSINGFLLTEERLSLKTLGPRVQKTWVLVTSILNSFLGKSSVFFSPSFIHSEEKAYILHQACDRNFYKC